MFLVELPSWIILIIILGVAAVVALIAFVISRFLRLKLKKDDKPSEEQILQEEMDRYLQPIEDEKTARAIEQYKDSDE